MDDTMSTDIQFTFKGFALDKDGERVVRRPAASARPKARGKRQWSRAARDWQKPITRTNGKP